MAAGVAVRTLLSDSPEVKRILAEDFRAVHAHLPENLDEDFALAFNEEEQALRRAAGDRG